MKKIIIYLSRVNKIGGVETFAFNFCKRMSRHYDITFVYDQCSSLDYLIKISEFVSVHVLDNYQFECETLLLASAWGKNPEKQIKSDKQIQMVHADYLAYMEDWHFTYKKYDKTTHHIAVGHHVAKQFEIATTYKIDSVIHNLLNDDVKFTPKTKSKQLRLVTISRISIEKGFDRMLKMESLLSGIDFIWDVYGDTSTACAKSVIPKFIKVNFKGITDKPQEIMQQYDFVVQLSDTEGFPYSIYEALQVHVPCIVTDFPSAHELIKNNVNGYILDMNLDNFVVPNKITLNSFHGKSDERDWIKVL